ncbi:unnamed protein product [Hyaloperonospora brassicae]|uniref:EGF-like domain-containing protein n=1 Tax=Hyaloperonospora brassicae TaxID=162125 RepID=A0AAV0V2E3_HYABA|nr:unnamed protein product [Hyaloperonospora brassicae]
MRVLGLLLLLTLQSAATATNSAAIDCVTNQDCSDGETCVAGDSATPVQSCVAGAVCGGSTSGNCPGNAESGQLACLLHEGIYKCLSIDRCDEYFGGSVCSAGCKVNGEQCSGHGSCSLLSMTSDATPHFGCTCLDGYSGDKCESGWSEGSSATSGSISRDSSGASSTSGSFSKGSGSSISTSDSFSRDSSGSISTSDSFSRDSSNSASASDSFLKDSSSSMSSSASTSASTSSAGSMANLTSGSMSGESSSHSSSATGSQKDPLLPRTAVSAEDTGEKATPHSANSGSTASETDSGGTSSAVFIIIGILAACTIVGALMFALFSRKKKREQEAEAGGFGASAASNGTPAALTSSGADTPKGNIVVM